MRSTTTLAGIAWRLLPVVLLALAGFTQLLPLASSLRAQDRSPVIGIPAADPDMNAAIERARASLPAFWSSLSGPKADEHDHALKVRFPTSGTGAEHIWVGDVKRLANGTYAGRLANQPRDMAGKNEGDPVEFKSADISDWMFMRKDKIVGGETLRVMLKAMPQADADALRSQMETP